MLICHTLPFMEGLLAHSVLLRLAVLVEVRPQSLGVLLVCGCKAQLEDALVETHCGRCDGISVAKINNSLV